MSSKKQANNIKEVPVIPEKKVETPPPPHFDEAAVDVNAFHQKYNSFLKDDEENKKRQAEYLSHFLDNTGLSMAFKIICAEVLAKNISPEDILSYTSGRLKELGKEIDKIRAGTNASTTSHAGPNTTTKPNPSAGAAPKK